MDESRVSRWCLREVSRRSRRARWCSRAAQFAILAALAVASGCLTVSVACGGLDGVHVALHLQTDQPEELTVHVITSEHVRTAIDYPVPVDGRVSFDVVREGMHCTYDHGWYQSSDDEPEDATLLEVRRGGTLLRSLTPRQLAQLPLDAEGFHRLRLLR